MRNLLLPFVAASLSLTATQSFSQIQVIKAAEITPSLAEQAGQTASLSQFAPSPSSTRQLDFQAWDQFLKEVVFYGGPSLRKFARRPDATVGSRFVFGHTSPYRLEGNRVVFDTMNDEYAAFVDDYIDDLVNIGNRLDIPSLQKDEQLSYWLNLHNALVIQAIADEYPVSSPSKIKGEDGSDFHDTKRVTLSGVDLSLRDIREGIVYQNWSDPLVIYGFFHGTIGSPSIQRVAYTSEKLRDTLRFSALEFANSLRGFHVRNDRGLVSRHYQDAAPYFFPNFDADLRAHLASLLDPEVASELSGVRGELRTVRYEDDIADLSRGTSNRRPSSFIQSAGRDGTTRLAGTTLDRAIQEHNEKFREIRERGLFGTVIIEDIETPEETTTGNTVD
ncbi:MAG: DUF547 domain-containing protein [Pseudomonadota bacterium]